MALYFKKYRFAPKWYFALATLVLSALFIHLGYWQLSRATEKNSLQAAFNTRLHAAPLSLEQLLSYTDKRYYPLQVTGVYDNAHTVLLDNKIHAHQIGYEVVTPLVISPEQPALLINRGWIPAGPTRTVLPVIPPILGKQVVLGNVYLPPGKSFSLGPVTEAKETWPLRMQVLDIPFLQNKLYRPIYPFVLLLSPQAQAGFVRDWQPVAMPAQKNMGYAVQWFAFAGVLISIFLLLSMRKIGSTENS